MRRKTRIALAAGVITVTFAGVGAVVVSANSAEDPATPITGTELDKVSSDLVGWIFREVKQLSGFPF